MRSDRDPQELRSPERLQHSQPVFHLIYSPAFAGADDIDDDKKERWEDVYSIGGAREKQAEIGEKLGQDSEIVPWEGVDRLLLACPHATQFSVLR